MRLFRLLLPLLLLTVAAPARAAFEFSDIACETSSTNGTGTLTLSGAVSGYLTFSGAGITSGSTVPYHIRSGGNLETGYGVFTDAVSDTLSRDAHWSTSGSGAELTLSSTSTVCIGPVTGISAWIKAAPRAFGSASGSMILFCPSVTILPTRICSKRCRPRP